MQTIEETKLDTLRSKLADTEAKLSRKRDSLKDRITAYRDALVDPELDTQKSQRLLDKTKQEIKSFEEECEHLEAAVALEEVNSGEQSRKEDSCLLEETRVVLRDLVQSELLPALESLRVANQRIYDAWLRYQGSLQAGRESRHRYALPLPVFRETGEPDYPGVIENDRSALARWRRVLEKNGGAWLFDGVDVPKEE